ncbi:hypothetical protein RHMOL_Rhmol05G0256600 [Rhododendron molle]|uniref:Uncharacterized protein n=1 Tax=Rhododendron molle TaxID=49168 RepID=A0ACC0NT92_RHOML|nr:hypothetical protein RHMOL_Rhmol05G0256600 [Rhododendron molle]
MSKPGALDLANSVGGTIAKEDVNNAVEKYEKYHCYYGGDEKERKANYADMVLDVGCGIGGPLREIARFSMTSITGLNNNEYQITRGKELNRKAGLDKTCDYVKADFMKMPFPDNSFDAAYALEATCHAPDAVGCYEEIHRVLKPGQCFAAFEWCMTDSFDPNNEEHLNIKKEIELGNGLTDVRTRAQCLEALKQVGFELMALEYVGLAPKGSQRVQAFLEKAADGLFAGGRKGIFTANYIFLVRKPQLDGSSRSTTE